MGRHVPRTKIVYRTHKIPKVPRCNAGQAYPSRNTTRTFELKSTLGTIYYGNL